MRNAIIPTAGETLNVTIPALRTLVVKRFTSEETGEFLAPVSQSVVTVAKTENTADSSAKTVRPARRNRA